MTASYYRGAHGILLVYDVTNIESFENLKMWMADLTRFSNLNANKIFIGNKTDLPDRKIPKNIAQVRVHNALNKATRHVTEISREL
jgi:GTPase SAR1 family protein